MKRFLGICLAAMLLLSGCGGANSEGTATPDTEPQAAAENPAEAEETPEYEDLSAPFSAVHSGADVTVREGQNRFEVYVDCADLDINTQPENWDSLCTAYETAMMESQAISDESYEGKTVSFQLRAPPRQSCAAAMEAAFSSTLLLLHPKIPRPMIPGLLWRNTISFLLG